MWLCERILVSWTEAEYECNWYQFTGIFRLILFCWNSINILLTGKLLFSMSNVRNELLFKNNFPNSMYKLSIIDITLYNSSCYLIYLN